MSKWPMRGHFRHLRFKTFPMTPRTPKARCFAPCCRALNIRESQRTPNPPLSKCWASPPHLAKVGLRHLRPILVLHMVNCTQWNVINSRNVLWNLLHPPKTWFNTYFGNIDNILKTIRRCQMLTGGYTMKRINSDPILSLWSLRSLLECQLVVDVNSTESKVTHRIHFDFH